MRDRLNLFLLQSIMVKFENCPKQNNWRQTPVLLPTLGLSRVRPKPIFRPNLPIFTVVLNFWFRPNFWIVSIFGQNFGVWAELYFWPKFRFCSVFWWHSGTTDYLVYDRSRYLGQMFHFSYNIELFVSARILAFWAERSVRFFDSIPALLSI